MQSKVITILLAAQTALNQLDVKHADDNESPLHAHDFRNRLLFADLGNGLDIEYYGDFWDDGEPCAWGIFLEAIAKPTIANNLTSLRMMGPDEGANGNRTHDFTQLLNTKAHFPQLLALTIRQTNVTHHNFADIKDGQIRPLIARCPNLQALTLPQAPKPNFFELALPNLRYLDIGMAWQTHDFIQHLAASNNMPTLKALSFSDAISVFEAQNIAKKQASIMAQKTALAQSKANTSQLLQSVLGYSAEQLAEIEAMQANAMLEADKNSEFDDSITAFADYCALFQSKRLKQGSVFHLRNAFLTADEFLYLQAMRPDLQFSASIEAPHVYINHWAGKFNKPYQHLIIPR